MLASFRVGGACVLAGVGLVAGYARGEIFFSDNFETAPEVSTHAPIVFPDIPTDDVDADPVAQVGTWWNKDKTGAGSLSEQVTSYTALGPPVIGPRSGNNYLRMQHPQDTEAMATFTAPQTSDVRLDTWIYVPYVSFRIFMEDSAQNYGNLLSWGEGAPGYLTNHNGGFQATSVPYTLDTWQHLIIDFHIGSASYDVSLDGISETGIPMAFGVGVLSDYSQILFAGGGTPSAYLDDVVISTPVVESKWNVDSDGSWSNGANWQGGVPNAADAIASFTNAISAAHVVTVDAPQTVGIINFDNANSYTLSGTSTITLDGSAGQVAINVLSGNHTISAPLVLAKDTAVSISGGGVLSVQHVRGAGLSVSGGAMKVTAKGTANDPSGTSVVTALSIGTGASLDLTNNSMVIDYTTVGTLVDDTRLMLQSGKLTTSSSGGKIGYGDNAVLAKGSFAGQTPDSTSLLIKFTYGGDANLDGQVDISDLGSLATAWQTSAPWTGGDFDYSGFVDISDLGILATNWQLGVGSPLGPSFDEALASVGLAGVSVPEPTVVSLLGLCLAGVASRRHRREAAVTKRA